MYNIYNIEDYLVLIPEFEYLLPKFKCLSYRSNNILS